MSQALHTASEVTIALFFLAVLIWPRIFDDVADVDARAKDNIHIS